MNGLLVRFVDDESGEDLIEYGLLAAFVAALGTAVVIKDPLHLQHALRDAFKDAKKALHKASDD